MAVLTDLLPVPADLRSVVSVSEMVGDAGEETELPKEGSTPLADTRHHRNDGSVDRTMRPHGWTVELVLAVTVGRALHGSGRRTNSRGKMVVPSPPP